MNVFVMRQYMCNRDKVTIYFDYFCIVIFHWWGEREERGFYRLGERRRQWDEWVRRRDNGEKKRSRKLQS